ncbi:glyoxylase-like metal-dependent hydrolase (beta-lactamase superfamily II) [Actinoplanes campanulatus]|uniref:Glyoxylase-like metal-dependent hydrolase (Beta-lactamase superfamily II) n=1 Tax=Actinoplanes campanulatus TaxID=113559 RepID=A0A7W5ACV3_9ACTN|nr:MBL fold metallo-hydrolase [Actinoplanes campanulatus]MBB3093634.1 glyoxylase-like metal-dependent hydrolase (beta-lactamase superfamily II) [Actinoplanes campanulatus]GGN04640.1 hydrolase [Actinoplanes campanulatus]GID35289.1 hydrolase [Actinoplanes campanulatus]
MSSEYTGDVVTGGEPAVRDLGDGLTLTKVSVGAMDNNAYLLRAATGEQLLIDAANDAGTLLALIGPAGLRAVVTTHRHADHWQALDEVVKATGAESLAHADDAAGIPVVTRTLLDGDTVEVGGHTLDVIHVVGHTPGSIVLSYRGEHLFTGDSLFPGGHGRTASPENHHQIMDHLEARVFGRFGDATWFYPGHGKDSTLGAERPNLQEWRARGW